MGKGFVTWGQDDFFFFPAFVTFLIEIFVIVV